MTAVIAALLIFPVLSSRGHCPGIAGRNVCPSADASIYVFHARLGWIGARRHWGDSGSCRAMSGVDAGIKMQPAKEESGKMTSRVAFLYKFFLEPGKIGSITPSSSFLTSAMLASLPWDHMETIVELGAGTGVFTHFIAKHKKASCQVLVIERDFAMRKLLRIAHPTFHYGAKAERLDWLLHRHNLPPADCIISGLPFAAFSKPLRREIVTAVYHSLKPGGIFVAFQYSLQMKKTLNTYFNEVIIDFVPLNMPPAFVYYCKKQSAAITGRRVEE